MRSPSGHKPLVECGHQLHDIALFESRTFKRLGLIEGQSIQVLIRTAECYGVAQGAGSGNIVDDFILRDTQKVVVEEL